MKLHFRFDEQVTPPGSLSQYISHPYHEDERGIQISVFNHHRYAFFFWNKWARKIKKEKKAQSPPSLITLDWHQDLAYPEEIEKQWLRTLDLSSNKDVALHSWANLNALNDNHIMSAAYLNLIGNIYIHCRQGKYDNDWEDEKIVDMYGNTHIVKKFKEYQELQDFLLASNESKVYFDIDLDFFTLNNPFQAGERGNYTYLSDTTIKDMLNYEHPLIQWIFQRIEGITIATEPEHTGGLLKSNKLLNLVNKIWFRPSLFKYNPGQWHKGTNWRHLNKRPS